MGSLVDTECIRTPVSAQDGAPASPAFLYKFIWVLAVALPMWSTFRSIELTKVMGLGALVDIAIIPWPYVLANYVKRGGDRWK